MGNVFSGKKRSAKVMKVDGTTLKFKLPVTARDVLSGHPGHMLMDSDDVKRIGLRVPPLGPEEPLKSKRVYFLVELPKTPAPGPSLFTSGGARRVQSGVNMTAKDRLESLMLKKRAASDIISLVRDVPDEGGGASEGGVRLRVRLPKSQVAKLVENSGGSGDAAERILELVRKKENGGRGSSSHVSGEIASSGELSSIKKEKRMRFAVQESEIIG